jgi:hypothetical protein
MERAKVYRSLMKISRKFENYMFREFFLRKTREDFRESDWNLEKALRFKDVVERQSIIQRLYPAEKSVIENKKVEKLGIY